MRMGTTEGLDVGLGRSRRSGGGACIVAGVVAGLVAAAVAVVTSRLLGGVPPARIAAGSSLAAGVIGGLLFWLLARVTRHAVGWLWGIALFCATVISLAVTFLPPAHLPLPASLSLLNGLASPLAQLLQAAGLLHPATAALHAGTAPPGGLPRLPARHGGGRGGFLLTAILMHYFAAVLTALIVPWVAGALSRGRPAT